MFKVLIGLIGGLLAVSWVAQAAPVDVKGSQDVPWIGRYSDSHIVWYARQAFDEVAFLTRTPQGPARDPADFLRAEGERTRLVYQVPAGRSSLEVFRNFEQQLAGAGFDTLHACQGDECRLTGGQLVNLAFGPEVNGSLSFSAGYYKSPRYAVFRRNASGLEQIAALFVGESTTGGPRVAVQAFERRAMDTDRIVVPSAAEMRKALDTLGRIALYGIYFDSGEARLKPESQPTLDQVVALMRSNPSLSLIVAGHTDGQGDYNANLRLSERRSAAVVAALVEQGKTPAARLTTFGAGMAAPAAPNDSDAGRAKNRRVELVKR